MANALQMYSKEVGELNDVKIKRGRSRCFTQWLEMHPFIANSLNCLIYFSIYLYILAPMNKAKRNKSALIQASGMYQCLLWTRYAQPTFKKALRPPMTEEIKRATLGTGRTKTKFSAQRSLFDKKRNKGQGIRNKDGRQRMRKKGKGPWERQTDIFVPKGQRTAYG